eukprot:SAG31_NODE_597_length_13674_cov_3.402947_5_plen_46_part_00
MGEVQLRGPRDREAKKALLSTYKQCNKAIPTTARGPTKGCCNGAS